TEQICKQSTCFVTLKQGSFVLSCCLIITLYFLAIYMFVSSNRSVSDLKRDHALFSLSTPTSDNGFLIYWQNENQEIRPHVRDARVEYGEWNYKPNMWHSICTTWDSVTGLVQIWFDGKPSIRKNTISGAITQTATLLLGQVIFTQNLHGGGFDINESFVGMVSDVHMWDYILSPCEVQNYMDKGSLTPGNVLNWKALDFWIIGNVLIENQVFLCCKFFSCENHFIG
uniref:Pentraxin family member n=1 Tax=Oryzias sinensis TaxID=183150 RepID=A0A8C7WV67_9TELE